MALGVKHVKLPLANVIAPVALITVPPVPTTSNNNVPPAIVIGRLIVILPPVLAAIPKMPFVKVNDVPIVIETVSKSPLKILPFVV